MKKVFLIHRWGGNSNSDWYPWIKKELENEGYQVTIPEMPDTENPKIDVWVNKLNKLINNEDIYLIGHSIGCQTILRYLEKGKIRGAVLVAPWFHLTNLETEEEKEIASPWLNTPINFQKVKKNCSQFTCIFSDNDPYVVLSDSNIFKEKLNSKIIIEKSKGHFTEPEIIKLPSALNSILSMN